MSDDVDEHQTMALAMIRSLFSNYDDIGNNDDGKSLNSHNDDDKESDYDNYDHDGEESVEVRSHLTD